MRINIKQDRVNSFIHLLFHDQATWTSFAFTAKHEDGINIVQEYHDMSRPYSIHQKWVTKNQLNKTKKLRSRYLSEYEYQLLMKLFDGDVIYMIEDGREYQQVILKTTNLLRNNKQFYQIEIDVELM